MPSILVDKLNLFKYLGREFTKEEFEDLCFEFGVEYEEDSIEDEREMMKIDIPANRYDLLCIEGLERGLSIYLGNENTPVYKLKENASGERLKIRAEESVKQVRQYVVGAILRNVTFTPDRYKSFIDLQDKLHMNICRKRSLVSIGTHDLDTVQAPFTYSARVPEKIKFVPLNKTQEYDAVELFKLYESDAHLKRFLDIIRDKPVYPLVTDSNDVVLSLPPIINSNHSKITLDTKNVLIEITATDLTKANIVLNVITTMFSVYCDDKYAVEPVDIVYPNGEVQTTPDFTPRVFEVDSDYVNRLIGVDLNSSEILGYLDKAGLKGTLGKHPLAPNADSITMQGSEPIKGELISVEVPPTRADIIHSCDIIEDIAISFGYNKIPRAMIELATVGKPLPLNKLGRLIRHELAYSGFIEVLPLSLCSHDELFKMLQRKDGGNEAVVLANPMTIEYQVCRTLLLPGVLKTIRENKGIALPFKVFEVGDVVLKDSTKERMARNEKRLCVAYSNKSAKFELVQGILDRVMAMLNVSNYFLRPIDDEQNDCEGGGMYLPKRGAHIVYNDNVVLGSIGILHPNVLGNFSLEYPVSTFEINIEPFV